MNDEQQFAFHFFQLYERVVGLQKTKHFAKLFRLVISGGGIADEITGQGVLFQNDFLFLS